MTNNWTQQKERGVEWLILLIRWIALHLGRGVARLFLFPITLYFLFSAKNSVLGSKDFFIRTKLYPPSWLNVAKHIHCFSSTILDRVFFLTGRFDHFNIGYHNLDIVIQNVSPDKGCILLGSHHGSFEVLRALNYKKNKIPLKVLMNLDHNALMTKILNSLNPGISQSVIELGKTDSMIKAMEFYDQGYLISLLADRHSSDADVKFVNCKFFGEWIKIPTGPFQLAIALKSPIIVFFGVYKGKNNYDICFELLTPSTDCKRDQRDKYIQLIAQDYVNYLEQYVRKNPFNWFNFYHYWG